MIKKKCPNCKSADLYREISVLAKQKVNNQKVYDIKKDAIDTVYQSVWCSKCGWTNALDK